MFNFYFSGFPFVGWGKRGWLPSGGFSRPKTFLKAPAGERVFGPWSLVPFLLVLTACAPREVRPPGDWMERREQLFAAYPAWMVAGRIGLSDGRRQGSLSFDWRAEGEHHRIGLRTGVGGKQWRLEFGPGYALLEGSDVDQLIGVSPDPLVEAAVGWPIPVTLMTDWIRGLPAPPGASLSFDNDGTLSGLIYDGWELQYTRYREYFENLLPQRLEANSGPNRVRIVVGSWELEG